MRIPESVTRNVSKFNKASVGVERVNESDFEAVETEALIDRTPIVNAKNHCMRFVLAYKKVRHSEKRLFFFASAVRCINEGGRGTPSFDCSTTRRLT